MSIPRREGFTWPCVHPCLYAWRCACAHMCANCVCTCMCVYVYVCFTVASPGPGIFSSSMNISELNESLLNEWTNTGKKRGWTKYRKIETVSGWGGRSTDTPNLSATKGRKPKREHNADVPLNSVPLINLSITFSATRMIICSPCIWDFTSWVFQSLELPLHHKLRKFLLI